MNFYVVLNVWSCWFCIFKFFFSVLYSVFGGLDFVLIWYVYGYVEFERVEIFFEVVVEVLEKVLKLCNKIELENC